MFTGIVQGTGRITALCDAGGVRSIMLECPDGFLHGVQQGASIALDGVCLTVVGFDDRVARFDVIDETLRITTLGSREVGDVVNVERAATFGAEIGGHVLSGHIIGTCTVISRDLHAGNLALTLLPPESLRTFLMPKGYVALDGISLTIGTVDPDDGRFTVHLIPETRSVTSIEDREVGAKINVEVDAMTQAVVETTERLLRARGLA